MLMPGCSVGSNVGDCLPPGGTLCPTSRAVRVSALLVEEEVQIDVVPQSTTGQLFYGSSRDPTAKINAPSSVWVPLVVMTADHNRDPHCGTFAVGYQQVP